MKIALIGYGKMGKAIEEIALQKGHEIVLKIDLNNLSEFNEDNLKNVDVAIEFTSPHTAFENIKKCLKANVAVVCGSTGWLDNFEEIKTYCKEQNGSFIYASNYSIGVNLFFALNKYLAQLMNNYEDYNVSIKEIHHTQKKDAPSGTAITIAEQILENINRKNIWTNKEAPSKNELEILSERIDPAPGTHIIKYANDIDEIEIIHTAKNRIGFASGAVLAAEYIYNKKGIFTMNDVLNIYK